MAKKEINATFVSQNLNLYATIRIGDIRWHGLRGRLIRAADQKKLF